MRKQPPRAVPQKIFSALAFKNIEKYSWRSPFLVKLQAVGLQL